jgi:hypothetical protein
MTHRFDPNPSETLRNPPIKAYVLRAEGGMFLKSEGDWTSLRDEAMSFNSTKSAMDFCEAKELPDVIIHLVLPNGDELDVRRDENAQEKQDTSSSRTE